MLKLHKFMTISLVLGDIGISKKQFIMTYRYIALSTFVLYKD